MKECVNCKYGKGIGSDVWCGHDTKGKENYMFETDYPYYKNIHDSNNIDICQTDMGFGHKYQQIKRAMMNDPKLRQKLLDPIKEWQSIGTIYGAGLEANLILHIPNNKDTRDVQDTPFMEDFKQFQYMPIKDTTITELQYLQNKIEDYCRSEMFVTYCGESALVLEIYDYRDRVKHR